MIAPSYEIGEGTIRFMNGQELEQYINQFALSFPPSPTQEQIDFLHEIKNLVQQMRFRRYLEKEELDVFHLMMERMMDS